MIATDEVRNRSGMSKKLTKGRRHEGWVQRRQQRIYGKGEPQ